MLRPNLYPGLAVPNIEIATVSSYHLLSSARSGPQKIRIFWSNSTLLWMELGGSKPVTALKCLAFWGNCWLHHSFLCISRDVCWCSESTGWRLGKQVPSHCIPGSIVWDGGNFTGDAPASPGYQMRMHPTILHNLAGISCFTHRASS